MSHFWAAAAGDRRADRAAPDHAAAAQAAGVSRRCGSSRSARQPTGGRCGCGIGCCWCCAARDHRAAGPGAGAAEHPGLGHAGRPGGAGGRGAGVRHRPAHGVSAAEQDPARSGAGDGRLAAAAIAGRERRGGGRLAQRLRPRLPSIAARPGSGSNGSTPARRRSRWPPPIEAALKLVQESDKPRKEVYVFTDLAQGRLVGRRDARPASGSSRQLAGVGIYVIDVGVEDPTNFGLGELRLSGQVLANNSPLRIEADLVHVGAGRGARRRVVPGRSRSATSRALRGQQAIRLSAGRVAAAPSFALLGLAPGMHQGYLKIVGEDALAGDDTRWFTVEVRPAWRVLDRRAREADREPKTTRCFFREALAPDDSPARRAAFECDVIATRRPGRQAARRVMPPSACSIRGRWRRPCGRSCTRTLPAGGGLGVFLGRNATPIEAFNEPVAQELLPGKLVRQWRAARRHAGAREFPASDAGQVPRLEVGRGKRFRCFAIGNWPTWPKEPAWCCPIPTTSRRSSSGPLGKGRVLTMTTPISDPANRGRTVEPAADGRRPWPFVMLANEMLVYLVGSGAAAAELHGRRDGRACTSIRPQRHPICSLTTPRGDQIRARRSTKSRMRSSSPRPKRRATIASQAGGGERSGSTRASASTCRPTSASWTARATQELKADLRRHRISPGAQPRRDRPQRQRRPRRPGTVSVPDRAVGPRAGVRAGAVEPLLPGPRRLAVATVRVPAQLVRQRRRPCRKPPARSGQAVHERVVLQSGRRLWRWSAAWRWCWFCC